MIRIARLTDYGVALMTSLVREGGQEAVTARDLAERLGLPLPTVSKLLKLLARAELLVSQRGVHGGYSLARAPGEITLTELLSALEGPLAVTECSGDETADCGCGLEASCGMRENWTWINRRIMASLEEVTLQEMAGSLDRCPGKPSRPGATGGGENA